MTSTEPTALSENARVVKALFEATERGDADGMRAMLHPDIVLYEPDSLPHGGTHRGVDAFFGDVRFRLINDGFDLGITDHTVIDGGDRVVGHMIITYTSRRTSETLQAPYVQLYRVRDGLVSEIDVYPKDSQVIVQFMADHR